MENLDLYNIIKRLIEHNIEAEQAEAIAKEIKAVEKSKLSKLASLKFVDNRINDFCLRLETKIALLKSEILKWFIGVSLVQTSSFIATIITALHFLLKN